MPTIFQYTFCLFTNQLQSGYKLVPQPSQQLKRLHILRSPLERLDKHCNYRRSLNYGGGNALFGLV